VEPDREFSPLLVTPNLNVELNSISETYRQLMALPNCREFAAELEAWAGDLYIASGYGRGTIINNLILQLLLINGYLSVNDLATGRIAEKVNRETIASARMAAVRRLAPECLDDHEDPECHQDNAGNPEQL